MIWIWTGFIVLILLLLALDLGVFHRHAHVVTVKEALGWSVMWITLGLLFGAFVYWGYERHLLGLGSSIDPVDGQINDGTHALVKYLTGYVVEKSLSVDNIFVMAVIFSFLGVPPIYQHRVLFWGILGAIVLRGLMIGLGASLISQYTWILYIFGVFLIFTAFKMLFLESHGDPTDNTVVRWAKKFFPVTDRFHSHHFVVRAGSSQSQQPAVPGDEPHDDPAVAGAEPGRLMLTPLAITLILVETTEVIFAVDSIPAIFAITADPFLVFTSNVFAILGLRSLYFALGGLMEKFRYLKVSLAVVLAVVGVKMLIAKQLKAWIGPSFNIYLLVVVLAVLAAGVLASLRKPASEG